MNLLYSKNTKNTKTHTQPEPKETVYLEDCKYQSAYFCAHNSSDNFSSYPPDNHHSSDVV